LYSNNLKITVMKKQYLWFILIGIMVVGCELEQLPEAQTSRGPVFSSVQGLDLYANSFYTMLPGGTSRDEMSDYLAVKTLPSFLQPAFAPTNSSGWDWGDLRNINYFLKYNVNPVISLDTRKNYNGIAKFFRALFYFNKVVRFGDVPWIGKPLAVSDTTILYGPRNSRTLIMDSVLADINYACTNITSTVNSTRSLVTKYVAYALKSRICLFEGTFRKYHTELGLTASASFWLTEAASAAQAVIDADIYSIYTTGGPTKAYRTLFTNPTPIGDEVMLAQVMDLTLNELHDANWWWTSGTYGAKASFIRSFINTYLMIDGTPFTNTPDWQTMLFKDEVKGRDGRLQQSIRMGDYKRISAGDQIPGPPVFSYTFTGYQPIKWTLDDMYYDTRDLNINSIALFRYAEVLLNLAEAKAELGILTDAEWEATVGTLRSRAGITGGLTTKPTVADPYLQSVYFPDITDPVILEVRRERGIELSLEGLRFADILRWKRGELMKMEWNGFYVPAINTPMDLNEDGINDVAFYQGTTQPSLGKIEYVNVSEMIGTNFNSQRLKNNTYGELTWMNNLERVFEDRHYFYPIPEADRLTNPNLGQNPGWD